MKLIDNARHWYKMAVLQVVAVFGIFLSLPPDKQEILLNFVHLPKEWVPGLMVVLAIAARLLKQPSVSGAPPAPASQDADPLRR